MAISDSLNILLSAGEINNHKMNSIFEMYQMILMIPLFIALIYRFYNQIALEDYFGENKEFKKFPRHLLDNVIKIGLIVPLLYFHCDVILKIYLSRYSNFKEILILLQNITIILLLWNAFKINYYSWFIIAPVSFYVAKICTGNFYLYLGYIASVGLCIFGLSQSPWCLRPNYLRIIYFIFIYPLKSNKG